MIETIYKVDALIDESIQNYHLMINIDGFEKKIYQYALSELEQGLDAFCRDVERVFNLQSVKLSSFVYGNNEKQILVESTKAYRIFLRYVHNCFKEAKCVDVTFPKSLQYKCETAIKDSFNDETAFLSKILSSFNGKKVKIEENYFASDIYRNITSNIRLILDTNVFMHEGVDFKRYLDNKRIHFWISYNVLLELDAIKDARIPSLMGAKGRMRKILGLIEEYKNQSTGKVLIGKGTLAKIDLEYSDINDDSNKKIDKDGKIISEVKHMLENDKPQFPVMISFDKIFRLRISAICPDLHVLSSFEELDKMMNSQGQIG